MDTITKGNFRATIEQDEMTANPRDKDWQDNMAVMVCFHRRHSLGDEGHGYGIKDYPSWMDLEKAIVKKERPAAILPLYLFDHSGLTISTDMEKFRACDSAGWDWGQVGFVFVRKSHAELKGLTKAEARERAEAVIAAEVEEYDQHLTGDVWFIKVERLDEDGEAIEDVESCGGFFGYKYAETEANAMLDNLVAKVA